MQIYNSLDGSLAAMRNAPALLEQNTISLKRLYEINDVNKRIKQLMFYTSLFFIGYRRIFPEVNNHTMYPLLIGACTLSLGSSLYLQTVFSTVVTFRLSQSSNEEIRLEFDKIKKFAEYKFAILSLVAAAELGIHLYCGNYTIKGANDKLLVMRCVSGLIEGFVLAKLAVAHQI